MRVVASEGVCVVRLASWEEGLVYSYGMRRKYYNRLSSSLQPCALYCNRLASSLQLVLQQACLQPSACIATGLPPAFSHVPLPLAFCHVPLRLT